jgi:hypothetical protein
VLFNPIGEGSTSIGKTNDSGEYILQHSHGVTGAATGEYAVTITTYQEGDSSAKPPITAVPEKVPLVYRAGAGVPKATVKPEPNTIDFDLKPGPTEAPQPKGKRRGR